MQYLGENEEKKDTGMTNKLKMSVLIREKFELVAPTLTRSPESKALLIFT